MDLFCILKTVFGRPYDLIHKVAATELLQLSVFDYSNGVGSLPCKMKGQDAENSIQTNYTHVATACLTFLKDSQMPLLVMNPELSYQVCFCEILIPVLLLANSAIRKLWQLIGEQGNGQKHKNVV